MFDDLQKAIEWTKSQYPDCSFSVRQQKDGPTIISVKGPDKTLRTVVYVKQTNKEDEDVKKAV